MRTFKVGDYVQLSIKAQSLPAEWRKGVQLDDRGQVIRTRAEGEEILVRWDRAGEQWSPRLHLRIGPKPVSVTICKCCRRPLEIAQN